MRKLGAILLLCLAASGCVTTNGWVTRPQLGDWLEFMEQVNGLDAQALEQEYAVALEGLGAGTEAADRLRLAYLLSRPGLASQDIHRAQLLLTEIPAESAYAPIRDLMARELAQLVQLQAARERVQELETQLENLKSIDTELTEVQAEMEELSN